MSHKLGTLAASTFAALALFTPQEASALLQYGYWGYSINSDNASISVQNYDGPGGAVTIPDYIYGLPVTTLSALFSFNESLTSVSIPPTVTTIGGGCFGSCYNLTSVTIPPTVTSIGENAFEDCSSLKSITLPSGLTTIAFELCVGCSSLTSITIPQGVTSIGAFAFDGCVGLTSVTIPPNVTMFPLGVNNLNYAFSECHNLSKVCFQGNAPYDGGRIFYGDPVSTIYYVDGTSGWEATYDNIPTASCDQCVGIITDPPQTGLVLQPPTPPNQHQNLVMVIHGWTPGSSTPYSDDAAMPTLAGAIDTSLQASGAWTNWDVKFYNWSPSSGGSPQNAVRNADNIGRQLGQQIAASGQYKKVQLISHSAGTWLANGIAQELWGNTNISLSVTFLDSYVPSAVFIKGNGADDYYTPDLLGQSVPMVEQYFHENVPGTGLGNVLPNAVNYDITWLQGCSGDSAWWDAHGWPIRWYTQTVNNPTWCYGEGFGYPDAFNIQANKGLDEVLSCPSCSSSGQAQSQMAVSSDNFAQGAQAQGTVDSANYEQGTLTTASGEVIPLPPMPPGFVEYMENLAAVSHDSIAAQETGAPMPPGGTDGGSSDTNSTPAQPQYSSPAMPQIEVLGSDVPFADLTTLTQGGNGTITPDTNGVGMDFSTTNFVWGTFAVSTTNDITLGTVDYALSAPSDSVLGMYLDGQPMQYIQSSTNNPLTSYEIFPLSSVLGMGNHNLTVSLESLDGAPITATLNTVGLYYYESQPVITSQSVTNGNFAFSWEAGAGLNYQPKYTTNLTSGVWQNLGGLLTSPTNAIMTAFDAIGTNQQRFYGVALVQ
jgi:hypothetical protein